MRATILSLPLGQWNQRLEPLHRAPPVLSVCLTPAARGHVPRASVPPRSGKHSTSSSYDEPASTALDVAQQQRQRRRQEQQPQQHQHQQRPASSGWPRPQEDVCQAISLRLKRAIDVKEVLMVVRLHAERFNEVNTALAFAQLARHLRWQDAQAITSTLAHVDAVRLRCLAAAHAPRLSGRQLTMVLTSLAWTAAGRAECGHHEQAHAAALGASDDTAAALVAALAVRLVAQLDVTEPEDICHCLWALARLGSLDSNKGAAALVAATTHGVSTGWVLLLTAKPLVSLLWVHAQAQLLQRSRHQQQQEQQREVAAAGLVEAAVPQAPLLQERDQHMQQLRELTPALLSIALRELQAPGFLATWTPQELSMLMWSCAVLGVQVEQPPPQQQQRQQPQQNALQQPALPSAVLEEVCRLAAQQVGRFTPQGVANTAWALSRMLRPRSSSCSSIAAPTTAADLADLEPAEPPLVPQQQPLLLPACVARLLDTLCGAAAAQLHFYSPQEVANLWSACAALRLPHASLTAAVSRYASQRAHQLSARDAFELAIGMATLGCGTQAVLAPPPPLLAALSARLRTGARELSPYEAAGAAWALARLGDELLGRQRCGMRPLLRPGDAALLRAECMTAARAVLAGFVTGTPAAEQYSLARDGGDRGGGGRPVVLMLWAAAATCVTDERCNTPVSTHSSAAEHPPGGPLAASGGSSLLLCQLLPLAEAAVASCSVETLLQLLAVLQRCSHALKAREREHRRWRLGPDAAAEAAEQAQAAADLARIAAAAQTRLLPLVPQLAPQHAALAACAVQQLMAASGAQQGAQQQTPLAAAATAASGELLLLRSCLAHSLASQQQQQQQQQLVRQQQRLPGQTAVALLSCCMRSGLVLDPGAQAALAASVMQDLPQLAAGQVVQLLQLLDAPQQQLQRLAVLAGEQLLSRLGTMLRTSGGRRAQQQQQQQALKMRRREQQQQQQQQRGQEQQQQLLDLAPQDLLTLAAACVRLLEQADAVQQQQQQQQQRSLPLLSELLLGTLEAWQHLLADGAAPDARAALTMAWIAARSRVGSAQSQAPGLAAAAAGLLQQELAARRPGALRAACDALSLLERLRVQPARALLRTLGRCVAAQARHLQLGDLARALHATASLGAPSPELAAVTVARLSQRGALAQLPRSLRTELLWALMLAGAGVQGGALPRAGGVLAARLALHAVAAAATAAGGSGSTPAAVLPPPTPAQRVLLAQSLQLLGTQRHRAAGIALSHMLRRVRPAALQPAVRVLLATPLRELDQLLCTPQTDAHSAVLGGGSARRQHLAALLSAGPQGVVDLVAARGGALAAARLAPLAPLWLEQQLQQLGTSCLTAALTSSGVARSRLRLRHLADGSVALLLLPLGVDSGGGDGDRAAGGRGVAVLLEPHAARPEIGTSLLGEAAARAALLSSRGFVTHASPLECWLPAWALAAVSGRRRLVGADASAEARAALLDRLLPKTAAAA